MESAATKRANRALMRELTERLIIEMRDVAPAGSVIRTVARCQENLLSAGVRQGLVPATEAMARTRLRNGRGALVGSCRT